MSVIDLSHRLRAGVRTYPRLPSPEVEDYLSFDASRSHYAEGTEFQIRKLSMITSTGTYLDAPRHRFRDGADVASIALSQCVSLPAVVLDVRGSTGIGVDAVPAE